MGVGPICTKILFSNTVQNNISWNIGYGLYFVTREQSLIKECAVEHGLSNVAGEEVRWKQGQLQNLEILFREELLTS